MDLRILTNVCQHCKNWFNAANQPRDFYKERRSSKSKHWKPEGIPEPFLALIDDIEKFSKSDLNVKNSITSEKFGPTGYDRNLDYTAWQTAFREELRLWCRLQTI